MDFFSSRRFVTTVLVVLVLLNITLLGVFWWQNMQAEKTTPLTITRQVEREVYFSMPLSLTEEQARRFKELRREHFLKVRSDIKAIATLKHQIIDEAFMAEPDNEKITRLASELGDHQAVIESELANHFHELAAVCQPAQRDTLRAMLEQLLTRKVSSRERRLHSRP